MKFIQKRLGHKSLKVTEKGISRITSPLDNLDLNIINKKIKRVKNLNEIFAQYCVYTYKISGVHAINLRGYKH